MSLENLKITVLRAAKPGDVVFFNVGPPHTLESRELVVALADYLRPTGIIPVMLPDNIRMVGSIFEAPALPAPMGALIDLRNEAARLARASMDGSERERNTIHHILQRLDEILDNQFKPVPVPSPQTAGSPGPEKTQSTDVHDTGPSAD